MTAELARFLTTAPLSVSHGSFDELIVQAVEPGETPIGEWDLHAGGYGAPEVAALAAQHLNADTAYIVSAKWDLWSFDIESLKWQQRPEPLELTCHGLAYDDGIAATAGHFAAGLGFGDFFSGHGKFLAPRAAWHLLHSPAPPGVVPIR